VLRHAVITACVEGRLALCALRGSTPSHLKRQRDARRHQGGRKRGRVLLLIVSLRGSAAPVRWCLAAGASGSRSHGGGGVSAVAVERGDRLQVLLLPPGVHTGRGTSTSTAADCSC
jgi:hypothetical protein